MEPQGLLIAVSAVAVALWLYSVRWARREITPRRRAILVTIRIAFLLSLVALWYRPTVARTRYEEKPAHVAIVLDDSDSMTLEDASPAGDGEGVSRAQVADRIVFQPDGLADALAARDIRVTVHAMSDGRILKDGNAYRPNQTGSDLVKSIRYLGGAERTSRPDAFVLVSDGADTVNDNPAAYLSDAAVPVYTVGIGDASPQADLRLDAVAIPSTVFRREPFQAKATVARTGPAPRDFVLRVMDGETEIASATGQFEADSERATVPFDLLFEEEGERVLNFEVSMNATERELRNNKTTETALVLKEKRRIIALMGAPSLETKFILRALGEDLRLDVRPFYLLPQGLILDPLKTGTDKASNRDGLWAAISGADLIIASQLGNSGLTADDARRLYVYVSDDGGNLIWLGGEQSFGPAVVDGDLSKLFPFTVPRGNGGARLQSAVVVTERGLTAPGFEVLSQTGESRMPPLTQILPLGAVNPGGQVSLITSIPRAPAGADTAAAEEDETIQEGYPLYIDQRYGLGKVGVLLGTGTWRWAMSFADLGADDPRARAHARFWQGVVHGFFMGPGTGDLRIETNGSRFNVHENVSVWIQLDEQTASWFSEPAIAGELLRPDGTTVRIPLSRRQGQTGFYEGRFSLAWPGAYEFNARVGEKEGRVKLTARASGAEFAVLHQRRPILQNIATRTGGAYHDAASASQLPESLNLASTTVTRRSRVFAGQLPEVAFPVLALALIEWILRRRWSLP